MLTIARPTVVLPQPDSPTSPSVSPRASVERDAVDGAHLGRLARSRTPPKTGKRTCRSCTSRMASDVAHGTRRDRWQRTQWPGAPSMSGGSMSAHGSKRSGQRVTNLQPAGRSMDVGHDPGNRRQPLRFARRRRAAASRAGPACTDAAGCRTAPRTGATS